MTTVCPRAPRVEKTEDLEKQRTDTWRRRQEGKAT